MNRFLTLLFLGFIFFSVFSFANEKTQISVDGNKIIYHGEITTEANETVFVIYKNNIEKIRWISIKSIGGEVNAGLDLAEFISENGIKIEVDEYCLSSCANYVFTAANEKLITNYALIGFHGGTTGMAANMADYINTLPESEREVTQKKFDEYGEKTSAREISFFYKIEVDRKITTLGQGDEYKKYRDIGDYVGWYYSIHDLNKLGVKNISVLNPPWIFKQLSEKSKFFKVKA